MMKLMPLLQAITPFESNYHSFKNTIQNATAQKQANCFWKMILAEQIFYFKGLYMSRSYKQSYFGFLMQS